MNPQLLEQIKEASINGGEILVEGVVKVIVNDVGDYEIIDPFGWLNHVTPVDDALNDVIKVLNSFLSSRG